MIRKIVNYGLLCSCFVIAGCSGAEENKVSSVEVKVCPTSVSQTINGNIYSGTVEETKGTVLSFAVGGTVEEILVNEGDKITKGQLIAVLDKTSLERSYESAEAMLVQATDAYNRMKQLHDSNSLPEMQWVEVQSQLRQAQSAESIARKDLNDCCIYAPFSGVISQKNLEVGQNASPGMPVVKLVNITKVKVCISVPENEMNNMNQGMNAEIYVSALGEHFSGVIAEKGVVANTLSRSYEVKILVENPQGKLLPGMICEVNVSNNQEHRAIVLPAAVVQLSSDNQHYVWLYDQGKATRRFVGIGELTPQGISIVDGLNIGDEVIVEGWQKVSEGMEIVKQQVEK